MNDARKRDRAARLWYLGGLVLALLVACTAVVVASLGATRTAEEVAPQVTEALIQDARAQRVQNARAVLDAACTELTRRDLPCVADPGPDANAEQLTTAASTAQVLALLPEPIAQQLRDETPDGALLVLPQPNGTVTSPRDDQRGSGGSGGDAGQQRQQSEPIQPAQPGSVTPSATRGPRTAPAPEPDPPTVGPRRDPPLLPGLPLPRILLDL